MKLDEFFDAVEAHPQLRGVAIDKSGKEGEFAIEHTESKLTTVFPSAAVEKADWEVLEEILTGQRSMIELDRRLERNAREAAGKIFKKQAEELEEERESDFQLVDVNSLESDTSRSIGPEYLCHSVWKELALDAFFSEQGVSSNVTPLIEALVVGRLVAPGSERYTRQWAEKRLSYR